MMLKLKLQYFGHLMWRVDSLEKRPDAGRDWGQEEKGTPEDEIVGWHHWLDGREFEWTPGVGDGQGGRACCDSWGRKVGHNWATELNWTKQYDFGRLIGLLSFFISKKFAVMPGTSVLLSQRWSWLWFIESSQSQEEGPLPSASHCSRMHFDPYLQLCPTQRVIVPGTRRTEHPCPCPSL